MMDDIMFTIFVLLQVKHWYVDFVMQTPEMVAGKAIYGNPYGIIHSLQHAAFTLAILILVVNPFLAVAMAALDFLTHYHIDWVKMNYGNRDIQNPKFWNHLGLDQMAHQIVYLIIGSIVHL
jgi:hypothetical protein